MNDQTASPEDTTAQHYGDAARDAEAADKRKATADVVDKLKEMLAGLPDWQQRLITQSAKPEPVYEFRLVPAPGCGEPTSFFAHEQDVTEEGDAVFSTRMPDGGEMVTGLAARGTWHTARMVDELDRSVILAGRLAQAAGEPTPEPVPDFANRDYYAVGGQQHAADASRDVNVVATPGPSGPEEIGGGSHRADDAVAPGPGREETFRWLDPTRQA